MGFGNSGKSWNCLLTLSKAADVCNSSKVRKISIHFVFVYFALFVLLACVASVSSRGSSRKLGQELKKKKKMNDRGGGGERRNLPLSSSSTSSLPLPIQPFFLLPL